MQVDRSWKEEVRKFRELALGGRPGLAQARRQGLQLVQVVERRTTIPKSDRTSWTATVTALAGLAPQLGTNGRRRVVSDSSLGVLAVGGKSGLVVVVHKLVVVVDKLVVVVGKLVQVAGTSSLRCPRMIRCLSCFQHPTMIHHQVLRKDFRDRRRRNVHR